MTDHVPSSGAGDDRPSNREVLRRLDAQLRPISVDDELRLDGTANELEFMRYDQRAHQGIAMIVAGFLLLGAAPFVVLVLAVVGESVPSTTAIRIAVGVGGAIGIVVMIVGGWTWSSSVSMANYVARRMRRDEQGDGQ